METYRPRFSFVRDGGWGDIPTGHRDKPLFEAHRMTQNRLTVTHVYAIMTCGEREHPLRLNRLMTFVRGNYVLV